MICSQAAASNFSVTFVCVSFWENKEHLENNLNSMLLGVGFQYTSGFCSLEMFRNIERVANDLLLKGLIPRPASLSGDYPELLVLVIR